MIFVTGGTGFLGSYILQELVLQGKPVRALRRNRSFPFYLPASIAEKISWVEGDILDVTGLMELLDGCDQIIHAAGMVSFHPGDRDQLFKINIEGTANMVNVAIEMGIHDFVHISSVGTLGRSADMKPMNEETKWLGNEGQSNYGISKYYGEMEVWRGMGEELTPLIVNPCTQLGYGDWNETSCAMFKSAYEQLAWYPVGSNGFADVQDTARAIVALMDSGIRNERFVISAENKSYQEIFNLMAAGFGKKGPSKKVTPLLSGIAWRVEKLKSLVNEKKPLLTRETARIGAHPSQYNNEKVLRAIPGFHFRPLEVSIREACVRYLKNLQPL